MAPDLMRIAVVTVQEPFLRGGAELLAEDLVHELQRAGHESVLVQVPFRDRSRAQVLASLQAVRLLDLADADQLIALKFPAYLVPHRRKVIWLLHQHRAVYELWDHPLGYSRLPAGPLLREVVRLADRASFREAHRRFTISARVSERLSSTIGFNARPLFPPSRLTAQLRPGPDHGYLFFPSRITPLKRHDLVVTALARCREPIRLQVAAPSSDLAFARQVRAQAHQLGIADRIHWLGNLNEAELVERYRHCRAVVFPPVDEDYGFVVPEAMAAAKPVITCHDSGTPARLVIDGSTGNVTPPTPSALARTLDRLWSEPARTRRMGEAGLERYLQLDIGWSTVLRELLS